ncbi:MAG TPA: M6 family metalloprotease domain-containing protein [Fimbriiglobus sp.]|jgi:M6 family metalloprotease-like protein
MKPSFLAAIATSILSFSLFAQSKPEKAPPPRNGLAGYRTVAEIIRADPKLVKPTTATVRPAGYLGLQVGESGGKPVVEDVEIDSPADKAGLRVGDVVRKIGDVEVKSGSAARDALRGHFAGDTLAVSVNRAGKRVEAVATLRAISRPMTPNANRLGIGVLLTNRDTSPGQVRNLTAGGVGEKAGIKVEDVILKVDGKALDVGIAISDLVSEKKAGDEVVVTYKRGALEREARVKLMEEVSVAGAGRGGFGGRGGAGGGRGAGGGGRRGGGGGRGARGATGWDDRLPQAWKKKTYNLAVFGVEYADVKHNPKITDKDWEASLFSVGTYKGKNVTGQTVYGSMNDYYKEISYGNFKIDGKFMGWVEMPKKRMEYSTGTGSSNREKADFLSGSMDKVLAAKGKEALKDYDGVFVVYAGGRPNGTTRGSLYWPHRSSFNHDGKRWPYFIVNELQSNQMTNISVFCHEFGHMLGLPDLYARPEIPGMFGIGVWGVMSQQAGNGRPQHYSAWSKEQLNWIKPAIVDPRVKQKIVLSPIEDDPTQCVKVIVRTDGSEYFLLENRQRKGFDASLPAAGLLIWRVMPGNQIQKVFIVESHGIEGANGPRVNLGAVPFPSPSNTSFTPFTTPSSKSALGGGFDVFITDIRRLPDGRVTFQIGYEFQ